MNRGRRRRTAALAAVLLTASCGASCELRDADKSVRSALSAFALAGNPVQAVIVDGCIAREQLIALQAEAGSITVEVARQQLAPVRARCDIARQVLDKIRKVHSEASARVEAGDLEAARTLLVRLEEEWRQLATWGTP